MLDRESDAQVPLHTDGSQEESAVVDGHVEDKARQRTEGIGQVPLHVVHGFLHLEGQKQEEEEVRDGQVEQKDVDWCGSLPHFLPKGVEGQDIGGEAQHKGNDVDRETQPSLTLLHVVFKFIFTQLSGIEMCHIMSFTLTQESLICHAVQSQGHKSFLFAQWPGNNPTRQGGFTVSTSYPSLIFSLRALSSDNKRE